MTAVFGKLAASFVVLMCGFAIAQDWHDETTARKLRHTRYRQAAGWCIGGLFVSVIGLVWSL